MTKSTRTTIVATAALAAALGCSGGPRPETAPATVPPPAVVVEQAPVDLELSAAVEAAPEVRELAPGEEPEDEVAVGEPELLLHEAMDAYRTAETFRQQGAIEDALLTLDGAYERMSAVPADGDPILAQEKANLRHLIARRVVEIHASRQRAVGEPSREIPRVLNDDVRQEIASFQGREREAFLEAYRRSGLYRPMMVAKLAEAGLPEQLSWLPLVESWFKDRALSRARALGLWQFIPSTGYRYGLDRSDWIDERMDPEKSTEAAIAYLTALHDLFGDWLTALAAYNCGEGNVLRQIRNQSVSYFDQFWDLYQRLPRETRRYVPRFLATLEILDDPAKYGFELPEPLAPIPAETIELARSAKLESLDRALQLESGTLARLNPELRRNATPSGLYKLRVPAGTGGLVTASLASLPKYEPPPMQATTTHRVRSGETLSQIAGRYGTSVSAIMAANRLRSANRLAVGQRLEIPVRGGRVSAADGGSATRIAAGEAVSHRVRPGDSLWILANRYGTTVEQIRNDNNLAGNDLRPGQVLTIRGRSGA